MQFEHDSIVGYVQRVTQSRKRNKKTPDKEPALTVYVFVRLMDGEEFEPVLAGLLGLDRKGFEDWRDAHAPTFDSMRFSARFPRHRVNFRLNNATLATLDDATIDGFRLDFADLGVELRIRAVVPGKVVGQLVELIGDKFRIETVQMQTELELGDAA